MLAWRTSTARRCKDLSGQGAAIHGGRWNELDDQALYMGLTHAITVLETLVNLNGSPAHDMKSVLFELPDDPSLYLRPAISSLPADWECFPHGSASMSFGSKFLKSKSHLGLIVPSAVAPLESNIVINPNHPAASRISIKQIYEFAFDKRLLEMLDRAET